VQVLIVYEFGLKTPIHVPIRAFLVFVNSVNIIMTSRHSYTDDRNKKNDNSLIVLTPKCESLSWRFEEALMVEKTWFQPLSIKTA